MLGQQRVRASVSALAGLSTKFPQNKIMSARIEINRVMVENAMDLAIRMYHHFGGRDGAYRNQNALEHHFTGKIGEVACAQWAANLGVPYDPAFRCINRMREADLILYPRSLNPLRIEVKSCSSTPGSWHQLGRCVPFEQMGRVVMESDVVMWCVVTPCPDLIMRWHHGFEILGKAVIEGWNKSTEVASTKPTPTGWLCQRQVFNHQIPLRQMRPLDQLGPRLRRQAP